MNDREIDAKLGALRDLIVEARNAGKIRSCYGLHGHVALLHDRLQRWFEEKDSARKLDEISGLAVDAVVAFLLAFPYQEVSAKDLIAQANLEDEEYLAKLAKSMSTPVEIKDGVYDFDETTEEDEQVSQRGKPDLLRQGRKRTVSREDPERGLRPDLLDGVHESLQ